MPIDDAADWAATAAGEADSRRLTLDREAHTLRAEAGSKEAEARRWAREAAWAQEAHEALQAREHAKQAAERILALAEDATAWENKLGGIKRAARAIIDGKPWPPEGGSGGEAD